MPTPDPCGPPCWPGIPPLQDPPQEVAYASYLVVIDTNGNTAMLAQPTNLGVLVWDGSKFYWADGSDTYQLNLTQLPNVADAVAGILAKTTTGRIVNLVNPTATVMLLTCANGVWSLSAPGDEALGGDLAPTLGSGILAKLAGLGQAPFWLTEQGLVYVDNLANGVRIVNGTPGSVLTITQAGQPAFAPPSAGSVGAGSGAFGVGIPGVVAGSTSTAAVNVKVASIVTTNGADQETVLNVNVTFDFVNGVGLGGLDVGAEANSTWYYLYVTTDGAGAINIIASTNPVAPNLSATAHSYYALVSVFRNNASGFIVQYLQRGRKFSTELLLWSNDFSVTTALNAIASGTNLNTILPPNVMTVDGLIGGSDHVDSNNPHTMVVASTASGIGKQIVGSRNTSGLPNVEGFKQDAGSFYDLIIADGAAPAIYARAETNNIKRRISISGYSIG